MKRLGDMRLGVGAFPGVHDISLQLLSEALNMQNEAAADVVDGDTLHEGDGVSALQLPPTVSPAQVEVWRRAGRTDSASNDIALCDLCTVLQVRGRLKLDLSNITSDARDRGCNAQPQSTHGPVVPPIEDRLFFFLFK